MVEKFHWALKRWRCHRAGDDEGMAEAFDCCAAGPATVGDGRGHGHGNSWLFVGEGG